MGQPRLAALAFLVSPLFPLPLSFLSPSSLLPHGQRAAALAGVWGLRLLSPFGGTGDGYRVYAPCFCPHFLCPLSVVGQKKVWGLGIVLSGNLASN